MRKCNYAAYVKAMMPQYVANLDDIAGVKPYWPYLVDETHLTAHIWRRIYIYTSRWGSGMRKPPRHDPKSQALAATACSIRIPTPSTIHCSPPTRFSIPGIWYRFATRWCDATTPMACPSATRQLHSVSPGRPSTRLRAHLRRLVWPASCHVPRGPKDGHKLSAKVVAFVTDLKASQPELTTPQCLAAIEAQFGVNVHRRSLERALARKKKSLSPTS